jgi:hypothetical protein
MKLTVFGAPGGTGLQVVEQALAAGHGSGPLCATRRVWALAGTASGSWLPM